MMARTLCRNLETSCEPLGLHQGSEMRTSQYGHMPSWPNQPPTLNSLQKFCQDVIILSSSRLCVVESKNCPQAEQQVAVSVGSNGVPLFGPQHLITLNENKFTSENAKNDVNDVEQK